MPNVTRAELGRQLHEELGLPRADCARLVDQILEGVGDALAEGRCVKLSGFGSFLLRHKGARVGRNPKTGDPVHIAPRRVLAFRASDEVRRRVAST